MQRTFRRLTTLPRRIRAVLAILLVVGLVLVVRPDGLTLLRNLGLFVLLISLVVGVHEFCHLLTARALGVRVREFGLAFGPVLAERTFGGIRWRLNAIPFGGYVKLFGESDTDPDVDQPGSFARAHPAKRMAIYLAGPLSSLLFAVLVLMSIGALHNLNLEGDLRFAGTVLDIVVQKTLEGLASFLPVATSAPLSMPFVGLPGMIGAAGTMADLGLDAFLVLVAILSFSLGIFNLLPLPPLDGGQAALTGLRWLTGPRYPARAVALVSRATFGFLLGLMALVNLLDLVRTL
jgi:regulator of sigma E protease